MSEKGFGEKRQPMNARARAILYGSLFVIFILAVLIHLSTSDMQDLYVLILIAAIILGNVSYFSHRSGKSSNATNRNE